MKTTPRFTVALALLLLFVSAISSAQAAVTFTVSQVGSNVVVTGSGTFDLTALTFVGNSTASSGMAPASGVFSVGPIVSAAVTIYTGYTGPANFGSGSGTAASSGSGAEVVIETLTNYLAVPLGYVSGTLLTDSAIFNNATFASLGFTPGTYTYSWGAGAHADSLVITTAAPTVPDGGSTALLLGFGLTGLCAARCAVSRRKATATAAAA